MGARTRNAYRAAAVAFCNWCVETGRLLVQSVRQGAEGRRRRRPAPATPGADRRRIDAALGRGTPPAAVGRDDRFAGASEKAKRYAKLRDGNAPPAGTARAGTGVDLQDAGADRASQGRVGFDHRGASGARRRPALPGARTRPTKRTAKDRRYRFGPILPPIFEDGLPTRRRLCRKPPERAPAVRFDPKHQKRAETQPGRFCGARGAILSAVDCRRCRPIRRCSPCRAGLVRILDRDLVAAGIARRVKVDGKWKIDKRDERGRTVDVHALRHTFGTLLSKGGVAPRTAQAAMRHSNDRPDHERLHRSEALGRGRGDGIAAGAPSRGWKANGSKRPKCNGHR